MRLGLALRLVGAARLTCRAWPTCPMPGLGPQGCTGRIDPRKGQAARFLAPATANYIVYYIVYILQYHLQLSRLLHKVHDFEAGPSRSAWTWWRRLIYRRIDDQPITVRFQTGRPNAAISRRLQLAPSNLKVAKYFTNCNTARSALLPYYSFTNYSGNLRGRFAAFNRPLCERTSGVDLG